MTAPIKPMRTWIALVAGVLLATGAGCIKKPTAKLHDIRIVGLDFHKIDLVFDLAVHNPNNFQINLSALHYDLIASETVFARGTLASPVAALSARETTIIAAPVTIEYRALADVIGKIRSGEPVPYTFDAAMNFDWLIFPIPLNISHAGKIPPLRKPDWHFRDVRIVKGKESWLELSFDVVNPNTFALPLERLHGVIKYGSNVVVRVDEPSLQPVGAGETGVINLRVRADGPGVTAAMAKAILTGRRDAFSFDGELRLGAPQLLRKMLLDKEAGEE